MLWLIYGHLIALASGDVAIGYGCALRPDPGVLSAGSKRMFFASFNLGDATLITADVLLSCVRASGLLTLYSSSASSASGMVDHVARRSFRNWSGARAAGSRGAGGTA